MVSMCTTSLHSKFHKIVLWCECTRIIWMDNLLQVYIALVATPGPGACHYFVEVEGGEGDASISNGHNVEE